MTEKHQSIVDILKICFSLYADKVAVINHKSIITYRQIDSITSTIAKNIALYLDNSSESIGIPLIFDDYLLFILAVIAVLKIGRSYIPIDANYPGLKINNIFYDTNSTLFISDRVDRVYKKLHELSGEQSNIVGINFNDLKKPLETNQTYLNKQGDQNDIACLMFTSGSTGKPKAVMITHRGIIRVTHDPKYLSLSSSDVIAFHSNLAFDASAFELWGALLNGGSLVCIEHNELLDYKRLKKIIITNNISVMWQTTSLFNYYITRDYQDIYDSLRILLIGGERVNKKILQCYLRWPKRKCIVINGYGPTENTIFSTSYAFNCESDLNKKYESVTIGKPVDGTSMLIVDDDLKPVGNEVVGMLLLGGSGLAKGYLNNSKLTKKSFISISNEHGIIQRYYLSGDLGFYGEDGLIYYVGRKDRQVKINGFRVELEEIVQAIESYPSIREVVVRALDEDEQTYLVAYFTTKKQSKITLKLIKKYLVKILPNYMIPKFFIPISEMPRNKNQKIALEALPHPNKAHRLLSNERNIVTIKKSTLEAKVSSVWEKVLGHHEFDRESNFFDVGGDSIKLMSLLAELESEFNNLKILDLYKYTNIFSLVNFLQNK